MPRNHDPLVFDGAGELLFDGYRAGYEQLPSPAPGETRYRVLLNGVAVGEVKRIGPRCWLPSCTTPSSSPVASMVSLGYKSRFAACYWLARHVTADPELRGMIRAYAAQRSSPGAGDATFRQ